MADYKIGYRIFGKGERHNSNSNAIPFIYDILALDLVYTKQIRGTKYALN